MLDNVGLRYPHRASGAKAPRTLRPLPLLRIAVSATGGAHLCRDVYKRQIYALVLWLAAAVWLQKRAMNRCAKGGGGLGTPAARRVFNPENPEGVSETVSYTHLSRRSHAKTNGQQPLPASHALSFPWSHPISCLLYTSMAVRLGGCHRKRLGDDF